MSKKLMLNTWQKYLPNITRRIMVNGFTIKRLLSNIFLMFEYYDFKIKIIKKSLI